MGCPCVASRGTHVLGAFVEFFARFLGLAFRTPPARPSSLSSRARSLTSLYPPQLRRSLGWGHGFRRHEGRRRLRKTETFSSFGFETSFFRDNIPHFLRSLWPSLSQRRNACATHESWAGPPHFVVPRTSFPLTYRGLRCARKSSQ